LVRRRYHVDASKIDDGSIEVQNDGDPVNKVHRPN
jgi:hypothetical protein